jgi:polyisoprenoid-binding protein YceI
MRPSIVAATAIAIAPAALSAQQLEEYVVDVGHSIIEFSIPFGFTHVKGRFTDWRGTVLYDRSSPVHSSLTVVIDAGSIDTGWPHRDEHLRTSDFFDVERYPTITFQSDSLRSTAGGWIVDGRLTMHGVTKPVSLPTAIVSGAPQRSPESKNMMLDASSTLRLARTDFGITGGSQYNSWFDAVRAATMGDSISISLDVEAWWPDAASERSANVDAAIARIESNGIQAQIDRLRLARDSAQRGRTLGGKPGPAWPAYYRGVDLTVRGLVAEGHIADAVRLASEATTLFGNWPSYMLQGYVLAVAGDRRQSAAAFARAKSRYTPPPPSNEKFKQDDEDWWYLNQLALTALERGEKQPAIAVARVLTELYPSFARAYVTLGRALAANDDRSAASAAFATALRLDPRETRAIEWSRRTPVAAGKGRRESGEM